jgi:hypothetical protein
MVMAMALILGAIAIAMPTVPVLADGGTWSIQTVDDIDVNSTSIALDSHGYPHISYTTGFADSLHYASWTGSAWVKEMVDDVPAIVTSLALDSNDLPHIGYTVVGGASLHYARWTGTAWIKETVDPADVWDCSLALDSHDRPHISYATIGSNSLHYARWTGTAWAIETVDDIHVISTSLALDSNDRPHISYATGGLYSLHYAHWTGTAWVKEIVDPADVISTSIALDSHGYPHISYATVDLSGSLHYASWTGTAWIKETVDPAVVWDCSLALDSNDRPHISYFVGIGEIFRLIPDGSDNIIGGMLKYANWTGSAWDIQTVDQETTTWEGPDGAPSLVGIGGGKWSSIALDSSDYPHISYGSLVPSVNPTSLHYARLIPPDTATVNTATGTGTATFSTSAGGIAKLTATAPAEITCVALGVEFPHGFFSFNILGLDPGETVTVTITLPSPMPAGTQYWKCQNGTFIDCTSLLGDNDGDNVLTLTLTDGGLGDADGIANGTIIDPGGPAIPATAVHPNSGVQGQTLNTTITGINFTGATVVSFGAGITVNSFKVDSATQITASITIARNAAIGARNVSVTTPFGTGTLTGGFTVNSSAPQAKPRVSPRNPASMSVQYLDINPKQVYTNQPVTISTNVVNTGDEAGSLYVVLKINGNVEQTRMVSVGAHGAQPVKFTVVKAQPGTYTVDIGGQQGSFTVLGAGAATGSKTDGMIALAIIGILIIGTLVVLLLRLV